ncbi:hypothetical protein Syun_019410 [Stephania yunnanensis]|uniref:Uncharacterized protein n=1 Tax=Stephania yunnanensis TaxID=152371 RepID=A0AAP0NWN8_9MAGN
MIGCLVQSWGKAVFELLQSLRVYLHTTAAHDVTQDKTLINHEMTFLVIEDQVLLDTSVKYLSQVTKAKIE